MSSRVIAARWEEKPSIVITPDCVQVRDGVPEDPTQRSAFLAAKQLVYLERYWKLYLPEEPLLGDGEFVRAVLSRESRGEKTVAAEL